MPDYRIPKWRDQMYTLGDNRTYPGMIDAFREGSQCSVLVAYHGCKLLGYLCGYDKEERGDETREALAAVGAIPAVTAAMGRHLSSPRVLAMGCYAIQAFSDGHEAHTRMVVDAGGAEAVALVLEAWGARSSEVAEYCVACVATLSADGGGARRLGAAGTVEGVWRTMAAHLEGAKAEVQAYGCASLLRMTSDEANVRRLVGNPGAVDAVVGAMKKHISVPLVLQTCGRLVRPPSANQGDERALPPGK